MKHLAFVSLCLLMGAAELSAQPMPGVSGPARGPKLSGGTAKLLGENTAFTANMEMHTKGATAEDSMVIPGRLMFLAGKSRFEMDTAGMKGSKLPAQMAAQMKSLGMEKMVIISRPDKKLNLLLYPGMQAYVEMPSPEEPTKPEDYRIVNTELGKEFVEGQPCVKSKAMITDAQRRQQEAIVWYATGLKRFPLKIETSEQGNAYTLIFRNVSLSKPAEANFEAPAGFLKYDSVMTLMQQGMMKQRGGGFGNKHPGQLPPMGPSESGKKQ